MCGLVGMMTSTIASDKQLALFSNLLFVDKVRGEHATGIAKINPWRGTVAVHKKAMSATYFLGLEETKEFLDKDRGRIYLGHNRYATIGDKTKHENAHPFTEGHITLVHNGSVDRWTLKKLAGHGELVVDSNMVARTIAEVGIEEAIKKFSGAFALIWWDANERTLNFIRNNERPLWLAELSDGTLLWASEREFMDFFVLRKNSGMSYKTEPTELPVNLLVQFGFTEHGVLQDAGKPRTKKLEFTREEDPDPVSNYWPSYGRYNNKGKNNNPNTWENKANELMAYWRIPAKVGDRITIKVANLEAVRGTATNKVNVWGYYEGVDVVAFYVDLDLVKDAKYISACIMSCSESTVDYKNMKCREPRINVKVDGLQVVEEKAALVTKREPSAISLNTFPLKVQGHTFQRREDFIDFVGKGCSMCGTVPTTYNIHNSKMAVYGNTDNGAAPATLNDCEFICGGCIAESEGETK